MKKLNQSIKGNNNTQIGVINGDIVQSKKVINKVEVLHDKDLHITPQQQKEIKDNIDETVRLKSAGNESYRAKIYAEEWSALKNQFKVPSYQLITQEQFQDVIKWQKKRMQYNGAMSNARINDDEAWRKKRYTAINARYRNLGMSKEEFYEYASRELGLKKPFTSMKELSRLSVEKLYKKIFALTKKP